MSRTFFKKYLQIIMEANSYQNLNDAGESYSPGNTQIWFVRPEFSNQFNQGYDNLKQNMNALPKKLDDTHVLVGTLAETDPNKIYNLMQAEAWNPSGDGDELINQLGLNHSSMNVGDIIVTGKQTLIVDTKGFVDISTGENYNVVK